ncbi:disulfide-isomerase a6 [Brachionus plicatilis]|uniref:Disulfide-isomerase a6 n=1 Tax=Brachionus plicatilis TaxID=10195 RepID=A0A3M7T195_BRAPC|nr:disulfide-isomerase a6 [Brachionus plicatilis]
MENDKDSKIVDDITWVCSCKTGKRTLGCCSHVAALIYFMAFGRFNITNIPKPELRLKVVIIPIAYDSDENEDIVGIETSSNDMSKGLYQ